MLRTDLAIESKKDDQNYEKSEYKKGDITVCEIENREEKYITVSFDDLMRISDYGEIEKEVKNQIKALLPKEFEKIMVIGLGNREITPDSIGPSTAERLLATRHIAGEFAEKIGLSGLKSISVISPGVLGKTGVETGEITEGLVKKIMPDALIAIDALAAGSIKRVFRTVQITNTGISPGSGVKNSRKELSFKTLGVPVIAVGVPTVMTAQNLAFELCNKEPKEGEDFIVTPKDSDLLCHRISEILSKSINEALQPKIEPEILSALV